MRIFISLILLIITSLLSKTVYAFSCSGLQDPVIFDLGTFIVPNNLSIGDKIGGVYTLNETRVLNCTDTSGVQSSGIYIGASGEETGSRFDGRFIYKTGIKGIGYAIGAISRNCSNSGMVWVSSGSGLQNKAVCNSTSGLLSANMYITPTIQLYRIDDSLGSLTMNQFLVGSIFALVNGSQYGYRPVFIKATQLAHGCTVSVPGAISVNLNKVNRSSLNNDIGGVKGSIVHAFNINLTCDAASPIKMKIDSLQTAKTLYNQLGILSLSSSGSNAATGVGVQILKSDNTSFPLGTINSLGSISKGTQSISLLARYVQLPDADSITGGEANASATFTFTYH